MPNVSGDGEDSDKHHNALKRSQHWQAGNRFRLYEPRATHRKRRIPVSGNAGAPITTPLVKVFALEGLVKSNDKYGPMVTMAYSNDLADSLETPTTQMQTVEGLRSQYIQQEYGTTNLASASIQAAAGASICRGIRWKKPKQLSQVSQKDREEEKWQRSRRPLILQPARPFQSHQP